MTPDMDPDLGWHRLVLCLEQEQVAMLDLAAAIEASQDECMAGTLERQAVALAEIGLLRALAVHDLTEPLGMSADVSLRRLTATAPASVRAPLRAARAGLVHAAESLRAVGARCPDVVHLARHARGEGLSVFLGLDPAPANAPSSGSG